MIGALKPYPDYKRSGLLWVDRVPAHWDVIPNRALMRRRKVLVGAKHPEYQLLSLTKEGVIVPMSIPAKVSSQQTWVQAKR
jgi:type I restriction enzyme S subunit